MSEDPERARTPQDTKKTQTVFIHKLYDMLHDQSISHLIYWSGNLDSFYILPGEEFSKVLSLYFKHTNIASFIRQLNMYGFHKVNDNFNEEKSNKWEFKHSINQFKKGDLDSLKLIKRRSSKNLNSHKEIVNLAVTSNPQVGLQQPQGLVLGQQQPGQQPAQLGPGSGSAPGSSHGSISTPSHTHSHPHISHSPYYEENQYSPSSHNPASPKRPPLNPNTSFEHNINFKFIELNNYINNLKSELNYSHSKIEFLVGEFNKNQLDLISLVDIFDKFLARDSVKNEDDQDKSSISADLNNLKSSILAKLNTQIHQSTSSNTYHLSEGNSRNPSNSNIQIVPQSYPLNPNYTIFSHNEVALRNVRQRPSQGGPPGPPGPPPPQQQQQQQQPPQQHIPPHERNRSVFMDPLQPIPSRKNSIVLLDQQQQQHHDLASAKLRAGSTSYSPLTIGGQNNRLNSPNPLIKSTSPHSQPPPNSAMPQPPIKSYSQYPFPNMVQENKAINNVASDRYSPHLLTTRTNSLPVPIIEHPPHSQQQEYTSQNNASANYYVQRNSFTSMYDQQRSRHPSAQTSIPYNIKQPMIPPIQKQQSQTQQQPQQSTTPLSINPIFRAISPSSNPNSNRLPSPLSTSLPRSIPNPSTTPKQEKTSGGKNQLPSVSELDKSLKTSPHYSPMNSILNDRDDDDLDSKSNFDKDAKFKKRKLNDNEVTTT